MSRKAREIKYNIRIQDMTDKEKIEFQKLVDKEVAIFLINSLPIEVIKAIVDNYDNNKII